MMNPLTTDWITGESFNTVFHCMKANPYMAGLWIALNVGVVIYYMRIARIADKEIGKNDTDYRKIRFFIGVFVFCGITYLFAIVRVFWPIYPVQLLFLGVLLYVSRRFAIEAEKTGIFSGFINRQDSDSVKIQLLKKEIKAAKIEIDTLRMLLTKIGKSV